MLSVTLCGSHDVRCCQLPCVGVVISGAVSYTVRCHDVRRCQSHCVGVVMPGAVSYTVLVS